MSQLGQTLRAGRAGAEAQPAGGSGSMAWLGGCSERCLEPRDWATHEKRSFGQRHDRHGHGAARERPTGHRPQHSQCERTGDMPRPSRPSRPSRPRRPRRPQRPSCRARRRSQDRRIGSAIGLARACSRMPCLPSPVACGCAFPCAFSFALRFSAHSAHPVRWLAAGRWPVASRLCSRHGPGQRAAMPPCAPCDWVSARLAFSGAVRLQRAIRGATTLHCARCVGRRPRDPALGRGLIHV